MATVAQFALPTILFFLTLASGLWVSLAGKPYNGMLFNVHKLVALGTVVFASVQLSRMLQAANPLTLIIALLAVAAACVLALFASGAMLSMSKLSHGLMLGVHRVAPAVLGIVMAVVVGFLM